MLISLNEIKKLVKIPKEISTEEIVKLIGSRLVEVEGTEDLAKKYRGILIVKVVECEPIPETHLHLCKIDDGSNGGLVEVVCGAPNVHKGMLAVWLKPGCIVPETYGGENFKLGVRKIKGYESHGMLAGADELGFNAEHKEIVEIDPKFAKAGDYFVDKFELDDVILDIENKSLTHRPDAFGVIGFAREVAGILGIKFQEPRTKFGDLEITTTLKSDELNGYTQDLEKIKIQIQDKKLCPRYSVAVFEVNKGDALENEKYWTLQKTFLAKSGMRSVSKIVDATNCVMLMTGQPLHAFDYDKFVAIGGGNNPVINVRAGKKDEEIKLLDGRQVKIAESDIVIASNDKPVALAGAMGGEEAAIDGNTTKVILESATFSLYNLRKTQMIHGIFSEAITRFTKGQPTAGTVPALANCLRMLLDNPKEIIDYEDSGEMDRENVVKITTTQINSLLGTRYTINEIIRTLENVGFESEAIGEELLITIPKWRNDIGIPEDIIEEVGRLLGYDNIPLDLPKRTFTSAKKNEMFEFKRELRTILSERLAANEVLTYSFVSKKLLEKTGEKIENSYEIANSISPELQCFRQSIVPSLIDKIYENVRNGFKQFAIYEFNQISKRSSGLNDENVPEIENHLGMVLTGDFYAAKKMLLEAMQRVGVKMEIENNNVDEFPYFEKVRSAKVTINGETVGVVGEIKKRVLRKFKVETCAGFEINLDEVIRLREKKKIILHLSKYPFVERDLTVKVKTEEKFEVVKEALLEIFVDSSELVYRVKPTSIYQGENKKSKNISFHLSFANKERTLSATEISDIMNSIEQGVSKISAEIV